MKFTETGLPGALIIEHQPVADERGAFTRLWGREEFEQRGIEFAIDQCSIACNRASGTLRGMHYQIAPFAEAKVVLCSAGAFFDAIVDLRPDSPTYRKSFALELSLESPRALFVPAGFAHGYLTLREHTTVQYLISGTYSPTHARGVRWNDPAFNIRWPAAPAVISPRDRDYADFTA
jgi:dTDP-4-dehydrorhamnose 3,5-epimerase